MTVVTASADSSKALDDLLCVADLDGRLRQVTPSFALALGSTERDVLGRLLIDLVHPGDAAVASAALQQLSEGAAHVEFRSRLMGASGRDKFFAWHATADPETHLVFAVAHREQVPAAGQRTRQGSAAGIAAIVETAVDAIVSIDEHGVIDTVNGAAERLFGYTATELIGQNVSMLMPSPTQDEHDGYLKRYLDAGRKTVIGLSREFVGRRKDGATIDIEVSVNEMNLGGQRMFTGILRDISQRKKIEQALADHAAALTRSNLELQQFAYVASHDLQEPLRKISSYLDVLSADYGEHLDDQAREYIGFAVDGALRMRRMIVDLLAVSRLRVDMMSVGRCDTGDLVRAILQDYALAIADAGAVVVLADLPVVQADQAHIRQAFQNLISNAIKYRGTETLTLRISAQRYEEGWLFTVADNGIGFKQEYAEKAFRMFQRLVGRREYEGTGMGLAIVAKVVENHGGKIWAESQPGVGTTFFFTVPSIDGKPLVT